MTPILNPHASATHSVTVCPSEGPSYEAGLTIRADFAKAAMQGLLAHGTYGLDLKIRAEQAVREADALIAALNQPKTP